ncbi:MAG TPA: tetratricopeptide repeat protein [Pyrinomonadaceae bacterium]|nr:tetratricopeptide repeat protein [Pyrinomonadaceae bacterium]
MNSLSKKKAAAVLAVIGVLAVALVVFSFMRREKPASQSSAEMGQQATPADARIKAAQARIEQAPDTAEGYNLLASAYQQKARETGDFGFNAKAEEAISRSLEVEPANYDALKLRAKLLLTYHRFGEALDVARRAQAMRPQDHDVYGALTDALVELGDYEEAARAAQTMVNLRPDTASYSRVSYLRELHGDTEGAIEAMTVAVKASSPQDPENSAWCRVQLGNLLMNAGRLAEAESEFDRALRISPDYRMALEAKARARIAAGDFESAINIYKREQERNPNSADAALALGDLYTRTGQTQEAARQYELFESVERGNAAAENDWHHLVYFWADHDRNLDEALALARRARVSRRDIHTADALAWTLFKRGHIEEARTAIDEAMRLGTRDARILYHAGLIYNQSGDRRKAAQYLKLALDTNASFDVLQADAAQRVLDAINV